jgi:hypothetical protein
LQKISGLEKPECRYCKCDDIRILQVNHLITSTHKRNKFDNVNTILSGKQNIKELEVTCVLCNWNYSIKKRFNINNLKVIWNTNSDLNT